MVMTLGAIQNRKLASRLSQVTRNVLHLKAVKLTLAAQEAKATSRRLATEAMGHLAKAQVSSDTGALLALQQAQALVYQAISAVRQDENQ